MTGAEEALTWDAEMTPAARPHDAETNLRGITVLITGATSGLGLAMARALAECGATVAVGSRDRARATATAATLDQGAGHCFGVAIDVRDPASVAHAVAATLLEADGIDVLVNNAGVGMRAVNAAFLSTPQPFWEVSHQQFADSIATNLTGYFLAARAIVPHFLERGNGRIVNISMNHETMVRRGFVPYGPSRAGAEALSHIMAEDLRDRDVAVNLLLPGGATRTGMVPEAYATSRELLDPSIMARPIRWLCSEAAQGVTDQRIVATDFPRWLRNFTADRDR